MSVRPQAAIPVWETVKENAAPLERGRSVSILETAHDTQHDIAEQAKLLKHYERLVQPSEREDAPQCSNDIDDDPLVHWLSYIKYYQDTFPSDTHAQFLIFERCVRALSRQRRYANDLRFIRVCCKYADQTGRSLEVFQHFYQQKIGAETAIFWMAWGFVAEKLEDYGLAQKILDKGIRKQAQPLDKLQIRYQQFQRRMSRHWLNQSQQHQSLDDDYNDLNRSSTRGVLGGLSEDAVKRNDRTRREQHQHQRQHHRSALGVRPSHRQRRDTSSAGNAMQTGFSVFTDENEENRLENSPAGFRERQLEREEDRKKENVISAEPWNYRGSYAASYATTAAPPSSHQQQQQHHTTRSVSPFAVFVDEECASRMKQEEENIRRQAMVQRQAKDERKLKERAGPDVAERLSQDPLRYILHPDKVDKDRNRKLVSAEENSNASRIDKDKSKDKQKAMSTPAYNHNLLLNDGGQEQCFEEARYNAKYYQLMLSSDNVNTFVQHMTVDNSTMSMDDSYATNASMSLESIKPPLAHRYSPHPHKHAVVSKPVVKFHSNVSYHSAYANPSPRNTSSASSIVDERCAVGVTEGREEQTINTQLALKELSMMFSSPAVTTSEHAGYHNRNEDSCDVLQNVSFASNFSSAQNVDDEQDNLKPNGKTEAKIVSNKAHSIATSSFQIFCDTSSVDRRNSMPKDRMHDVKHSNATTSIGGAQVTQYSNNREYADDDTATFSIFGDIERDVGSLANTKREVDAKEAFTSDLADLSAILDIDIIPQNVQKRKLTSIDHNYNDNNESRNFHTDDTTEILSLTRASASYGDVYNESKQNQTILLSDGRCTRLQSKCLVKALSSTTIYKMYDHVVPRSIKSKSNCAGAIVQIGRCIGRIKRELGRGSYGSVLLLDHDDDNDSENRTSELALKVQLPLQCLGWEYEIYKRLERRTAKHVNILPFPRAKSLVLLADGGMLSMTASSSTGINLVNLVNIYSTKLGEKVPEIIVIYYTIRMLRHLELLHWHGKILHCDVKPDNWVLCQNDNMEVGDNVGSDLCLVDFGRAVDLADLATGQDSVMDVLLSGQACTAEMSCLAMRNGLPWSFDIDTFGLCASVHVLLFGTHIELEKSSDKKSWMPKSRFRRYHQKELWNDLFCTLINLEPITKTAIGSRPRSLREVRERFETYIEAESRPSDLATALKHQATLLLSL